MGGRRLSIWKRDKRRTARNERRNQTNFPDNSESAIALQGEKAYLGTGEGVAEVSKDDLTNYTQHDLIAGVNKSALTILEEGDLISGFVYRNLFSHDTEKQETIAEPSIPVDSEVSSDGDRLYTLTERGLTVYDVPKNMGEEFAVVDTAPHLGLAQTPPMISEGSDAKRIVSGTGYSPDGCKVQAYDFKDGDMERVWSKQINGDGNLEKGPHTIGVEGLAGVGDSVIVSAGKLYGFNLNNGDKLFEEDINGKVGMPHGKYVPVGTPDGTYVLEMETGKVSQETASPNPTPTPEPTPTETRTPKPTRTPTETSTPDETTSPKPGTTSEETPGFGPLAGLAGAAGGAAAVKRYLSQEDLDEE